MERAQPIPAIFTENRKRKLDTEPSPRSHIESDAHESRLRFASAIAYEDRVVHGGCAADRGTSKRSKPPE